MNLKENKEDANNDKASKIDNETEKVIELEVADEKNLKLESEEKVSLNEDKKEEVVQTLNEIAKEKAEKLNQGKKGKNFITVLKYVFFPITLLLIGIKKLTYKIKLPLTAKMTIIYSIVFSLILGGFTIFYLTSLSTRIEPGIESDKYMHNLYITSAMLLVVFIAVFTALVAVVTTTMLHPIRKITSRIDEISTDNLSARLENIDTQDELMKLTDRINNMLDNIEETFIRQHNFVADASHELKTPIAVIQGYSNLLSRWGKSDPAILNEGIDAINRESDNMKRIVEQLLLLAKLGKMNMVKSEFNLFEILDDMVDGYKVVAKTHKIVFDGDETIVLNTDKNLLLECVRTLFDNAVKYSPEGGKIEIECYMKGDSAKISVKDSGVGISEADIPKVFDRFFRCDKARGRETGSSGLGLTIALSIVEMMGGEIDVESELNKGSTFTISLY